MKIVVVGTGYVGLVTGTCFAEIGVDVVCVDIDAEKIARIERGDIPIYEPGLDEMVIRNMKAGRLRFATDLSACLDGVEILFSAVGTPPDEDGSADLRYVLDVAHSVGRYMTDYLVVVTKSTVPVGTARKVKAAIQSELDKRGEKIDFDVASNPEFLKEECDSRFYASRPCGRWGRKRAGGGFDAKALQALHDQQVQDYYYRYSFGGDD